MAGPNLPLFLPPTASAPPGLEGCGEDKAPLSRTRCAGKMMAHSIATMARGITTLWIIQSHHF